MIKRRKTRKIKAGNIYIGKDAPVSIQSMIKVDARKTAMAMTAASVSS